MQILKILLIPFLFAPQYFAQELITDRPDQTESAITVPLNVLQVETGFAYESFKEDNILVENYSIAGTLLRYGLNDNIELRLGAGYLVHKGEETIVDFDELLIGSKINFFRENEAPIDLGLMAHVVVPVFPIFAFQLSEPELIIAASKSLTNEVSISGNFGGLWDSQLTEINYLYTTAIGYSFTDRLNGFIEVYGNISPALSSQHNYDGGFTYLLNDDFQLDISGGKRFPGNDSFWFIGSGVSFRINNL